MKFLFFCLILFGLLGCSMTVEISSKFNKGKCFETNDDFVLIKNVFKNQENKTVINEVRTSKIDFMLLEHTIDIFYLPTNSYKEIPCSLFLNRQLEYINNKFELYTNTLFLEKETE